MKRRDFITRAALAGGALALGTQCARRIEQKPAASEASLKEGSVSGKFVTEPQRQIPVFAETDVLVVGGGPAGTAAAIAASKTGANVWLIERYNHLGGLWTGGGVLPLLSTHAIDKNKNKKQVIFGLGDEMWQRLKLMGMVIHDVNPVIDPEAGKFVLEEMIIESGVKVLYHTYASSVIMNGNQIQGVIIENKSGRSVILAKVVVDCTGDGDIFKFAGENYDSMKYYIGLVHRLGNVDRVKRDKPGYVKLDLGSETPIPGVNWLNMHGKDDQDGIDALALSNLQVEYRQKIWSDFKKMKQTPGYEDVFILDTASQLGVRMSRIVDGEYKLTIEDTMTFKKFDDCIGISGAWTPMLYKGKKVPIAERPLWQIPLRSLVPKKTDGLLVAGRCFCFEKELVEDTRIIGTCLITGHGAGAAAGVAVKEGQPVRDLDLKKLRKELLAQKVYLG
jgi:ribulose 1,5-bisphosphate synthetase/thiazole synthase